MNGSIRILMVVLVVSACAGVVCAEERRGQGEVHGTFVKLVERQVGEREVVGVVLQQVEGKGEVVVLMSRQQKDLLALARKLTKGQKIEIAYVAEDGQKWVKRLEVERRREGGRGDLAEFRRLVEKMQVRLKQLEREVVELREANARLRRKLATREGGDREDGRKNDREDGRKNDRNDREKNDRNDREKNDRNDREKNDRNDGGKNDRDGGEKGGADGFPTSLRGFRGMLTGTVKSKLDRGFVLKVEKVVRVWKANKASRPQDAVGKVLTLVVRADSRMGKRHLEIVGGLKVGDRVSVEAFHIEGNRLTLVEELRKVD